MHPMVFITVDGAPVAGTFYERLISFTVTDNEGVKADTFQMELNDGPPLFLALPRKGAIVRISIGYRVGGLRELGTFTVDQVSAKCLPYSLTISGKSADLRSGKLKENKERHWDDKSLKEIVEQIASENGLSAKISEKIGSHTYKWMGQQDESDIHFLERLARRHNALFTIKDGNLIFGDRGSGLSLSGTAMGTVSVTPAMVIKGSLSFEYNDRTKYSKVVAYYQDRDNAERVEVEASGEADGDSVYRIPEPFADAAEADEAAQSKSKQLKRGKGSVSVTIEGDTGVAAGAPLLFQNIRPGLDGVPYVIETATHSYSKRQGYRVQISGNLYDGSSASNGEDNASADTDTPAPNAPADAPAAPGSWGSASRMGFASPEQRR